MSFNENTNNLIIINYRPGAGGKFLSGCLALSEKALHLQENYAKTKYLKKWSEEQSFRASMSLLKLSEKHNIHIEYDHGISLYGFSYEDNFLSQLSKANIFFKELTNQKEYLFFLTNHFTHYKNFLYFKNSKNIIIVNDEEILKIRKKEKNKDTNIGKILENFKDCFLFDMSTVKNDELFLNEIKRLCFWLKTEIKNETFLSQLREQFVKNLKIRIIDLHKIKDWDNKGYYKGFFQK